MAKRKQIVDVYPNRIVERVTMTAANTITFQPIRFGTGLFSGVALVIHRVEYHLLLATLIEVIAGTDEVEFGLTNRDDLSALTALNLNILDVNALLGCISGTPATFVVEVKPIQKDFSTLPGGGLIIPTTPLYLAMDSVGLAAAGIMDVIMYYTFKQMSDSDYIELVQGMLPANI